MAMAQEVWDESDEETERYLDVFIKEMQQEEMEQEEIDVRDGRDQNVLGDQQLSQHDTGQNSGTGGARGTGHHPTVSENSPVAPIQTAPMPEDRAQSGQQDTGAAQ